MEELKPCPFCTDGARGISSRSSYSSTDEEGRPEFKLVHIYCTCGAKGKETSSLILKDVTAHEQREKDWFWAATVWNRRPIEDTIRAELDQLETAFGQYVYHTTDGKLSKPYDVLMLNAMHDDAVTAHVEEQTSSLRAELTATQQQLAQAQERVKVLDNLLTPRPADEWSEYYGDVLWWRLPAQEAPYLGSPLNSDWPDDDYYTHWTPIPRIEEPTP